MAESFTKPAKRMRTESGKEMVEVTVMLFSLSRSGLAVRAWDGTTYERDELGIPRAKHIYLPVSAIEDWDDLDYVTGQVVEILIPEWLAFEKELI